MFYPTPAVPAVSFLIHPGEMPSGTNYVVTDSETDKNQGRERIKVGKSSANVPGTTSQQKCHRETRTTKNTKQMKEMNSEMRQDTYDTRKNT